MKAFTSFPCSVCGHEVGPATGTNRKWNYEPGFDVMFPDELAIPTCGGCGEIYLTPDLELRLAGRWRREFLYAQAAHFRRLVGILSMRDGLTQQDIVRACGVTPSFFSRVVNGRRKASLTLTRLLEAFVACESEMRRHLEGRPWSQTGLYPFAVHKPSNDGFAVRNETKWHSVPARVDVESGPCLDYAS